MIIDTHTHLTDPSRRDNAMRYTKEEYFGVLDEHGVDLVWTSAVAGLYATGDYPASNRFMYEFFKGEEKRIVPFFTVNPNYGDTVLEEIKRCVEEYNFRGLKLHPWLQSFHISMPIVDRIIEQCIRYNIPLIFHDGTPPYSSTLQIANLAERYPEAIVILGHAGLCESYAEAIRAAKRLENIYLCLCGPSISQLQIIVDNVDPSRLLFGTDYTGPPNHAALRYRIEMWKYINISAETRDKVFFKNALALLT